MDGTTIFYADPRKIFHSPFTPWNLVWTYWPVLTLFRQVETPYADFHAQISFFFYAEIHVVMTHMKITIKTATPYAETEKKRLSIFPSKKPYAEK